MKAGVDRQRCQGYGLCHDICAEVFRLDDDGFAYVEDYDVAKEFELAALDAADACPTDAIAVS